MEPPRPLAWVVEPGANLSPIAGAGNRGVEVERTARGEETEVADAHEAGGKHMEQKASQELLHGQGHEALLVAVGGVSPAESDLVAGQGNEARVGDGDAMGVGAQVVEDILGPAEGRFAVDDPIPAEEWAQEGRESLG